MNGSAVAVIVKRSVATGFAPEPYSEHALRTALTTAVASVGAPTYNIRRHAQRKTDSMLQIYIGEGALCRHNVVSLLGL